MLYYVYYVYYIAVQLIDRLLSLYHPNGPHFIIRMDRNVLLMGVISNVDADCLVISKTKLSLRYAFLILF